MDRYVVIGNPVAHSLSPRIHARFARDTGESIRYETLLAPPGGFAQSAAAFFAAGGAGANVTLPFKVDAFSFADEASARARLAGAANFLARRDGRIAADNTDGAGLVADLVRNLGVPLEGTRILLLGAGGAARGVVGPLLAQRPRTLAIANRTAPRARELAAAFAAHGAVEALPLDALAGAFDLVINATSTSVHGEALALPPQVVAPGAMVYDMAYGEKARPFLAQAASVGARCSDGLGMLVEQAAESFLLWRGVRPPTEALLRELRAGRA